MKFNTARSITWIIISLVIFTHLNLRYWTNSNRIIAWDTISYYAYLPAIFIYHDATLKFSDNAPEEVKSKIWYQTDSKGNRIIKMSMGLSMLYAPFFFLAHLLAPLLGFDSNGYTTPYRFALIASCVFYLALALYFLRKTLSVFFSTSTVTLTTVAVVLGTNLFFYTTTEPTMSHAYNFSMFSAFIYLTLKWYEKPNLQKALLLGLLIGLISLARPSNILILLFFLLYDIKSISDLRERILLFRKHFFLLSLSAIGFIIVWLPQFIYWKAVSGQWLYYSYGDEGFFFSNPQIIKGLFGYRKGWLLYTPLMILALAGIPLLYKYCKSFFLPTIIFTVLNIYIILSWWCWWYGGGYGLRAFIDSYALLAIPLATFIQKMGSGKPYRKVISFTVIIIITAFSIFQTQQYRYGSIHWDSMSARAYWGTFCRLKPPDNFQDLLEAPDYEKAKKGMQE